ncbi:hypothetical protein IMY05_004G0098900 [Salix suchowensis]|nr:hypothetical protein IMY05_004G0098900 [Salix suchowensis]
MLQLVMISQDTDGTIACPSQTQTLLIQQVDRCFKSCVVAMVRQDYLIIHAILASISEPVGSPVATSSIAYNVWSGLQRLDANRSPSCHANSRKN